MKNGPRLTQRERKSRRISLILFNLLTQHNHTIPNQARIKSKYNVTNRFK